MCLLQIRRCQVEIFLCGDQRCMAQQFLNVANIHAMIQAVGCAAVTEDVWVYASDASALRSRNNDSIDLTCG